MKFKHKGNYIEFTHHPDRTKVRGYYDPLDKQIYLNKKLGLYAKECIYCHESAHREHYIRNCWCWNQKSDFWSEYHAMKEEFQQVRATKNKIMKRVYLNEVKATLLKAIENPKVWKAHGLAMMKLMKTKSFKEFRHQSKR